MRDIDPVSPRASGPKIDFAELERATFGYDLPGRPHTDYTIPGPGEIDSALLETILFRGGVPDRVVAGGAGRTTKHAHLVALAMLGDRDAAAFLKSKGFLTPAPLVACECEVLRPVLGEMAVADIEPRELTLRLVVDAAPLREAIGRLQEKVRALSAAGYVAIASKFGPKRPPQPWTGTLTFVDPDFHRDDPANR